MRPVCLLMIFLLFTLLYLIIKLKINLLVLLKEPSREKALLTLHVMTEMHFLLWENYKGKYVHEVLVNCLFKLAQERCGQVN